MSSPSLTPDLLRSIPIFDKMNDTECRQLAEIATRKEFKVGEYVLRQGETCQNLWIVLDGACEVIRQPDNGQAKAEGTLLAELQPYNNFGEMSFFHPAPHSADVRAKTPLTLLRIERADYQELVEEGASAAYKLSCNAIDCLAERLRRMDDWVADLLHEAAQSRIGLSTSEWSRFRDKLFTGWNL
jgi:CRP/FNR family cyclic AMP-dependent transcriptional regulator